MNILFLNTFERVGGAAVAANRLMKALSKGGHEVCMLVRDKQTDDANVISINTSWIRKKMNLIRFAWERLVIFAYNRFSRKNLFSVSIANTGTNISKHPLVKNADIIHLHWINHGFLSLKNIRQLLALGKPVVWTMHDMWPATGICHIVTNRAASNDCQAYMQQCGCCRFLAKPRANDLSHKIWKKKSVLFSKISFVGCSRWITGCAQESVLLKNAVATSIPNPIDVELFKLSDKKEARQKLHLPTDKKLILFAAAKLSDLRKGILYFVDACKNLTQQNIDAVFLGGKIDEDLLCSLPIPAHVLGYLHTPSDIAAAYSACDVFVTPSLSENLPNTIMEALACGTPCVGFDTGGIPEMIDHKKNGYVAGYKSAEDLARGIQWTLFEADYDQLSKNARQKVLDCYSEEIVAEQYMELYKKLLAKP